MTEWRLAPVGELPPYDHDEMCPKCHFATATTEYYASNHNERGRQCTLPGAALMALGMIYHQPDRKPEPDVLYKMPEHFERECPNCGHRWAEAVVPA